MVLLLLVEVYMRIIVKSLILAALLVGQASIVAVAREGHVSTYAGQEARAIKSLSPDDIAELERGGGWGLAKAAELNGLPGPLHLLELKEEIGLSSEQTHRVQALYDEMRTEAIVMGRQLIAQESRLEQYFQSGRPDADELLALLTDIEETRRQLRFIHLSTHLKTPVILTKEQIASYNSLRGYAANDPCQSIPKGHNAAMWKKHNGCN